MKSRQCFVENCGLQGMPTANAARLVCHHPDSSRHFASNNTLLLRLCGRPVVALATRYWAACTSILRVGSSKADRGTDTARRHRAPCPDVDAMLAENFEVGRRSERPKASGLQHQHQLPIEHLHTSMRKHRYTFSGALPASS